MEPHSDQTNTTGGEDRRRERKQKKWWYTAGVLAVVLGALLIVGTDLRRLRRGPGSSGEIRMTTDTTLARWRRNMYNRVRHLEKKYLGYRERDRKYTDRQSELAHGADSAFDAVYEELKVFDSIDTYRRRIRRARRIKRMFSDLKRPVHRFARSIFVADSLRDAERRSKALSLP